MGCGASNSASAPSTVSNPPQHSNFRTEAVISRRLVATRPYRHGSPITSRELDKQRTDFWATRTEGNAQMWQAIRSSAEALLANDVALANAIIEASSISSPNGSLELCYDERGYQYKVPLYCVANPTELSSGSAENSVSTAGGVLPSLTTSAPVIPEQKGKTAAAANGASAKASSATNNAPVNVKVRVYPGDHNMLLKADATNSIAELKAIIAAEAVSRGLPLQPLAIEPDRQRVILMGKELQNNLRIAECAFDETKVVQVFLRQQPKK